ncbi:MAG: aspartate-semialdehyde dehydrogenase [Pseudomonadota bacterium]
MSNRKSGPIIKKQPVIAIVGATGIVGNEMVVCLDQAQIDCRAVRLFASEDSVGEMYEVAGEEVVVELLDENSFKGVDIALFATSAELAKKFVPIAVESGAVVIDNSSAFRLSQGVPLVVPEVNGHLVTEDSKIIANPNCSTIQLVPILHAIHKAAGLKRVVVTTFQSVSGAGKAALDELWGQTLAIFNQQALPQEVFPHQIAFNCIPQIDVFMDDGYTKEEYKIIEESRKILDIPGLRITATAVRVPVFHSHAESVNIETERPLSVESFFGICGDVAGLALHRDDSDYPLQIDIANTDEIHVGRVRADLSVPHGLNMWVVADNVRKGAALNAVQIAQLLVKGRVQHSSHH